MIATRSYKLAALLITLGLLLSSTPRTRAFALQANTSDSLSPAQQLTKESNEAAGEEGSAQFKHSGPVRWISKLTGLDLESSYLLGMGINFAIIVGVIFWASRKSLPTFFRDRTATIQKAMQEARQASEDANRRLTDIESRLSRLATEIGEMRAVAEKDAAAEEERIKAATEEDAKKIVDSVEQEVTTAVRTARRELSAYAADLAVALAKKQIHVDAATDQTLVRQFATQLSDGDERKGRR